MKALALRGPGHVALVDKPLPEPGLTGAVVKTTAALLCTSDIHSATEAAGVPENWTLGHEAVGILHAVGPAVTGFTAGQRVAVGGVVPCFQCPSCQRGFPSQCGGRTMGATRFTQGDGVLAEYFLVPYAQANLAPIPAGVTDHQAVYAADMLSTGLVAVEHAHLAFGETVAVFGQGAVGLSVTIAARLTGAGLVVAIEPQARRRSLARHFGADVVLDPTAGDADVVWRIAELTDGAGVDAAVEACGTPRTWQDCFRVTKPGGRVSNIGYHDDTSTPLAVPHEAVGHGMADKQVRFALNAGGGERISRILRLIENGRVDPTAMTTHVHPFEDSVAAYHRMANQEDGVVKPLITFS